VTTRFGQYRKTTVRIRRKACPIPPVLSSAGTVEGYEIHMGETRRGNMGEAFEGDGAVSPDGLVIGTYLHGLFWNPMFLESLLTYLYRRKGLEFGGLRDEKDPYEAVADHFEMHVRMERILSSFESGSGRA
jgi:adenosylcobyric acid synthase